MQRKIVISKKFIINNFILSLLLICINSCQTFDNASKNQHIDKTVSHWKKISKKKYVTKVKQLADKLNMVDVRDIDPTIRVALKYATTDNIINKRIYPKNMLCLLKKPTAIKIANAHNILRRKGLGLKIYDAYRPPSAHSDLWASSKYNPYIQHPSFGWSLHCFGAALDCTIVDYATGENVKMPSKFDEFSEKASSFYHGDDPEIRKNNLTLKRAMVEVGMRPIPHEWWHFSDPSADESKPIFANELGIF